MCRNKIIFILRLSREILRAISLKIIISKKLVLFWKKKWQFLVFYKEIKKRGGKQKWLFKFFLSSNDVEIIRITTQNINILSHSEKEKKERKESKKFNAKHESKHLFTNLGSEIGTILMSHRF